MADTIRLERIASAWGFESLYGHKQRAREIVHLTVYETKGTGSNPVAGLAACMV